MRWFRWRLATIMRKTWNSGKEKMKTLGSRIYSSRTKSEGRDNHLDEIRIRFIVCLSFIKLNWWLAMDFSYYLFFLKMIKGNIAQNLRKSSWTNGRIGKNERINMINKEKNLERTIVRIQKWLMKENESPGRIRRPNMFEGI